jgi:hypothetical protein
MNTRVEKLRTVLTEVLSQDFGYPVDGELFAPASSEHLERLRNHAFPTDYVEFSRHCAGISAPDIHNGYFLHPVAAVLDWADENNCAENMLIGSTGEQGVALNTCPAASSIRHDHSTFNPQSKPRPRAGVRGLRRSYETAVNIVGQALHQQGFRIIHADRDYEADLSLLAESKFGTIAIKVTTRRAPVEPTFTKDEAARLKRLPRAQRYFMAPVGLMPVAERSPDGHLGFHAKYEGLIEI